METRNIMLVGVWGFTIVWLVGMLVVRGDLLFALFLFLIAIAVSFAAMAVAPSKKEEEEEAEEKTKKASEIRPFT